MTSQPRYTHDCDECVFLGPIGDEDLWFHDREDDDEGTIIFRFGSDGPDYSSYSVTTVQRLMTLAIADPKFAWADDQVEAYTNH